MKNILLKNKPVTPVVIQKTATPKQKPLPSLKFCLLMDLIGCAFIFIPLVGEIFDIIWAPISAFIFYRTFGGGKRGLLGGAFSFVEELIPGINFIPTFTIAWFMQYFKRNKETTTYSFKPIIRL